MIGKNNPNINCGMTRKAIADHFGETPQDMWSEIKRTQRKFKRNWIKMCGVYEVYVSDRDRFSWIYKP
jgi:hypothetical protein